MAVKFATVIERAKAREPELDDDRLEQLVLETIAACGLDVTASGEVYNPAEGSYRAAPARVARDQRWAGRRR